MTNGHPQAPSFAEPKGSTGLSPHRPEGTRTHSRSCPLDDSRGLRVTEAAIEP
ncbi:MAG: hypothetical protein AAFR63_13775 [Cyanobacteria bacterium J06631_6]